MANRTGSTRSLEPVDAGLPDGDDLIELTDRCARPKCRREFKQMASRGRRREYCSDTCRGNAEREFKQAKAAAAHYERLLRDARADVHAFGRGDTTESDVNSTKSLRRAFGAWSTARTAAEFADPGDNRLHGILSELVRAVEPLWESGQLNS